jgi:site-specific recombinase XerD
MSDLTPAWSTPLPFATTILAGQLAASSIRIYQRDVGVYATYAQEAQLDPLAATTLARWRTAQAEATNLSPNTINRRLAAVKRLLAAAAEQGYVSHELAEAFGDLKGVKRAALKERLKTNARTYLAPEAMRRLAEKPDQTTLKGLRDAALLATLASSGLRVSEAASLTVEQVLHEGTNFALLVRGKNEVDYARAPLSQEAHALIERWLEARPVTSRFLFTAFDGRGASRATARPLSARAVEQLVEQYATACKLPHVKPHDFRRFVGTQLARRDIRQAQKALRHKRIDTTAQHYVLDELELGLTNTLY